MDQLFEKFGLHWSLLLAQMVNFGILFFVLYKFAYKPILRILDQRREKIENSLQQAKEIEKRTEKMESEIAGQLANAKKQADVIVAEAKDVGEKARNEILVRTNAEVTGLVERAKNEIEQEKAKMLTDAKDYIVRTSMMVVEKILQDKLDQATKEKLVTESFQQLPNESFPHENKK